MKQKLLKDIWVVGVLLIAGFCLSACDSKLDIQQAYEFDIRTMPVRKDIKQNETVEVRCTLIETGNFADNRYTIRYFQSEGYGELQLGKDGDVFLPNDRYPLPDKEFRLYYTSRSDDSQQFEVVVEDSFGNERKLEFQFNAKDEDKRE
ncbi:MAG: DUF3872 domain-containing protein [Bacteroidales bacterium]|uniref:DUF3872 domain-containing protein n=1 Tax=Porphyromonas pogonae TaxID=867595 RepID=UPI001769BF36|nr:DUF3872 domain-containing protein [Porphyromonas pogonae]HHU97705.1 DUF3872 domain-containing protein [Petrimonas sp.]